MAKRAAPAQRGVAGVSHVGIAVRSIDSTLGFYEGVLGLTCEHIEEVPAQKVRAAFLRAGSTRVELIEPTDPASSVARFLEKRGEGLHHLAFEVEGIGAALGRAGAQGIELIDKAPRAGARGCMVAFLHPASCHGVLVEFVEEGGAAKAAKGSP